MQICFCTKLPLLDILHSYVHWQPHMSKWKRQLFAISRGIPGKSLVYAIQVWNNNVQSDLFSWRCIHFIKVYVIDFQQDLGQTQQELLSQSLLQSIYEQVGIVLQQRTYLVPQYYNWFLYWYSNAFLFLSIHPLFAMSTWKPINSLHLISYNVSRWLTQNVFELSHDLRLLQIVNNSPYLLKKLSQNCKISFSYQLLVQKWSSSLDL